MVWHTLDVNCGEVSFEFHHNDENSGVWLDDLFDVDKLSVAMKRIFRVDKKWNKSLVSTKMLTLWRVMRPL